MGSRGSRDYRLCRFGHDFHRRARVQRHLSIGDYGLSRLETGGDYRRCAFGPANLDWLHRHYLVGPNYIGEGTVGPTFTAAAGIVVAFARVCSVS